MKKAEAVAILSKLAKLKQEEVALSPEDWQGTGLTIKRKLVNQETKEVIFLYVNRLELIEAIRSAHNLHLRSQPFVVHRSHR